MSGYMFHELSSFDKYGYIWSSDVDTSLKENAWCIMMAELINGGFSTNTERCFGHPIRPVCN